MRFDLDCEIKPGEPLTLAIEDIDEDPEQPRQEFDTAALQELAETIKAGGVRQPISVRLHPDDPERWMLNFGARRLRASKLAGKTDIPAFVDKAAGGYDQVIENEQREGLTALELALFVQKRLAEGESQTEIARRLGKGRAYITYATALIDAPDWLMSLYREGRCRGARELHELRRLQEVRPDCVRALQAETSPVTRERLASLRATLARSRDDAPIAQDKEDLVRAGGADGALDATHTSRHAVVSASRSARVQANPIVASRATSAAELATDARLRLLARLGGSIVEIVTNDVPPEDGHIFVLTSGKALRAVEASRLQLLRIVAR